MAIQEDKLEYSIVVPVYNEEESLSDLHKRIVNTMQSISSSYEVIYVNDGSKDSSQDKLKLLAKSYSNVRLISWQANRGQSLAFFAGFKASTGNWIITLDADLQNPPEEIKHFIPWKKDFDFITGIRQKRNDSLERRISSRIAKDMRQMFLGDKTNDVGCSLRMFKREVVDHLPFFKNFHRFFTFLVGQQGFSIKELPVNHDKRNFGKSKYTTLKRAWEGFFDLYGVIWLKSRLLKVEKTNDKLWWD